MKNKALIFISITSILFAKSTFAQFYIELYSGYAAPLYFSGKNKVHEKDFTHAYTYQDTSFTMYGKYNMGNGLNFGSVLGYKTKNGISFGIDFFYLNNKDIHLFYNDFKHEWNMSYSWKYNESRPVYYSQSEQFVEYYAKIISVNPQIGYQFQFNKSSFGAFIGIYLSDITIYSNYILNEEWISDYTIDGSQYEPNGKFYHLTESVSKFKQNNKHISPVFSLKYNICLTEKISISTGLSLHPFISMDRTDRNYYYSSTRKIIIDSETFEEKDLDMTDIVPPGTTPEKYNLSTINLSLGFRYAFKEIKK